MTIAAGHLHMSCLSLSVEQYYKTQILRTWGDGPMAFVDGHRLSEAGGGWR